MIDFLVDFKKIKNYLYFIPGFNDHFLNFILKIIVYMTEYGIIIEKYLKYISKSNHKVEIIKKIFFHI